MIKPLQRSVASLPRLCDPLELGSEHMDGAFDSELTRLMARALDGALGRLRTLGLVDGDASGASARLSKLILEAVDAGERNEENLILFAIGRYQVTRPAAR